MSRNAKKLSGAKAQVKGTTSSDMLAFGVWQRRKGQTHKQAHDEGYDTAIRNCAEALLREGDSRDYIAYLLDSIGVPFPFTDDTIWDVSWAYDD